MSKDHFGISSTHSLPRSACIVQAIAIERVYFRELAKSCLVLKSVHSFFPCRRKSPRIIPFSKRSVTYIQATAEEFVVVIVLGSGAIVAPAGGPTGWGQHHAVGIDLLEANGQQQGHAEQVLHGGGIGFAFTFTMPLAR